MQKGLLIGLLGLLLIILLIPAFLVACDSDKRPEASAQVKEKYEKSALTIRVYLSDEKKIIELPLEKYIYGVVAAEMPADFHKEALKAQALAARTYIIDRLLRKDFTDLAQWGNVAKEAHVTDTMRHQVYKTDEALQREWGSRYQANHKKIEQAVAETAGQIITYEGEPIYAAFFSTSNGYTENSEDYFKRKYPYLRSVSSSWDRLSPKYLHEQTLSLHQFISRLEKETGQSISLPASAGGEPVQVTQRTEGKRVAKVKIGDRIFSGRKVREALQLASSDFEVEVQGGQVKITSFGYGHGVGMSQWGANLMAKEGKSAKEIIRHYYQGVDIVKTREDQVK
ncbi:stage II sporulation protein D [Thermoactinomyces mirandus]|uniref:Stage II sporulation protein D n=1 Tax=Thermoactinomyces mirandus TaxID=2756294 RepID=A0A7W2ARU7_9BACL|nr:stage II sporulation protein D [Thermoactinomyces mirandus]MBA4602978.1 stage II sporulation protein D [Thermoactinomyces mirandus]